MNDSKSFSQQQYPCPECQAGIVRFKEITYFTWLGDELIIVPNFPAWVCDLCGMREYDQRAIAWLKTLLHPNAGNSPDTRSSSQASYRTAEDRPVFRNKG